MNKSELVDRIADRTGLSKKDVGVVLDGAAVEIANVVASSDDKVTLPGLASFERVYRKERKGHNPQTGQPMIHPPSHAVKVSATNKLKAYAKGTENPPN